MELNNQDRAKLEGLAAYLSVFETPGFLFGHWTKPNGTSILPSFVHTPEARSFIKAAYALGWILSEFDWGKWKETEEAKELRDDPKALDSASTEQIAKLLTTVIRQDRFVEGALESAYSSGLLNAILGRMKAILSSTI